MKKEKQKLEKWPMEKQRRSRVDWESMFSRSIAISQESYERRATARAMRAEGLKLREIGERFGVTSERARSLSLYIPRRDGESPVEREIAKMQRKIPWNIGIKNRMA